VIVARPRVLPRGVASRVMPYDGLPVYECPLPDARLPLARGVARQERFWPRFAAFLADLARRERADLIHGQHLLSVPAAVAAARRAGVPSVATVRDYWPTCPLGTRLPRCPDAPRCSAACQVCCLARGRRVLRPAVRALLPYVRANLARRQRALRAAGRVLAVSNHVAAVLRAAIPGLDPLVLPNFIDPRAVAAAADAPGAAPESWAGPTVLYAGKLEYHKGADLLPAAVAAVPGARLVVAGDGPLADSIARECAARGVALDLRGQLPNDEVLRLMHGADALLFPARWEEPLSRTLLEAGAAGLPAVALATGGTPDIVADGETGVLVADPAALGPALAALLADPARRARLGAAARERTAASFGEDAVVPRVEVVYRELVGE
ncbi:MAG TPA: glycosyltransferase family 4 protein, partial [Thermomicrobiales bacterium]|nr:glycosyltransferase family 4 protein [Thermomicrobiales bacterium]